MPTSSTKVMSLTDLKGSKLPGSNCENKNKKLICFGERLLRSAWDVTGERSLWVLLLCSIMINTYQTSMALPQVPPPLPPRLGRSHPVLIQASLPSPGYNKPLQRFLVCVVILHLFLSVGGFLYLYYNEKQIAHATYSSPQGRVDFPPTDKQETTNRAMARMVPLSKQPYSPPQPGKSGYLPWNVEHSFLKNINYFNYTWLTILEPGDYFVYSTVTFSKGSSKLPLASSIMLRKTKSTKETLAMIAYCSLSNNKTAASNPQMCTAAQHDVIRLEKGNQLSIWVEDLSLLDYDTHATRFGMYKI